MRGGRVAVRLLAMPVRRRGMMLGGFVFAGSMMMRGLVVVVRSRMMVGSGVQMTLVMPVRVVRVRVLLGCC